jgi:hypothetical protein
LGKNTISTDSSYPKVNITMFLFNILPNILETSGRYHKHSSTMPIYPLLMKVSNNEVSIMNINIRYYLQEYPVNPPVIPKLIDRTTLQDLIANYLP